MDLAPPTVTLEAPAVAGGTFSVKWNGDDGDGSGLVAYDLQYQDNDGPWHDWFTATRQTEATFTGQVYHTYTFHVQARDLVGHTNEWVSASVDVVDQTKYYYLEGRRVAMRRGEVVHYLYGDHLGSTSLTTDSEGAVVAESRYLPYGGLRWQAGTLPTDFTYTGQRQAGFGLYDYNARYYSAVLGRFVSADSIVPEPGNPQDLNRFLYVRNNPLLYIDPSGHQGEPWWEKVWRKVGDVTQDWVDAKMQEPHHGGTVLSVSYTVGVRAFGIGPVESRSFDIITDEEGGIAIAFSKAVGEINAGFSMANDIIMDQPNEYKSPGFDEFMDGMGLDDWMIPQASFSIIKGDVNNIPDNGVPYHYSDFDGYAVNRTYDYFVFTSAMSFSFAEGEIQTLPSVQSLGFNAGFPPVAAARYPTETEGTPSGFGFEYFRNRDNKFPVAVCRTLKFCGGN